MTDLGVKAWDGSLAILCRQQSSLLQMPDHMRVLGGVRVVRDHDDGLVKAFNLIPVLTAFENVELPLLLTKMTPQQRRDHVMTALKLVGLEERVNHLPKQLSGGQEQRVAIARAIVSDPTLILADEPTGEIANTLTVARSNVSTSLRELQGWGIVRVVHALGDRRDHFESVKDVWEIFRIVAEERKRREIDPTLRVLEECVGELKGAGAASAYTRERLEEMLDFLTTTSGLFEEIVRLPAAKLKGIARLRGKLSVMFGKGKTSHK